MTKPIGKSVENPHKGTGVPAENWQRGYDGLRCLAATGSDAHKFWQEGKAARIETSEPAKRIAELDLELSLLTDIGPGECSNCGSTDLKWHCGHANNSNVVEGRLRSSDISTVFYLGCNNCSETLKVVNGDFIATRLTLTHKANLSKK